MKLNTITYILLVTCGVQQSYAMMPWMRTMLPSQGRAAQDAEKVVYETRERSMREKREKELAAARKKAEKKAQFNHHMNAIFHEAAQECAVDDKAQFKVVHDSPDYPEGLCDPDGVISINGLRAQKTMQVHGEQGRRVIKHILCHELQHYKCNHWVKKQIFYQAYPGLVGFWLKETKHLKSSFYVSRAFERQADLMACLDAAGNIKKDVVEGGIYFHLGPLMAHCFDKQKNIITDYVADDDLYETHPSDASRIVHLSQLYFQDTKPTQRQIVERILCGHEHDPLKRCPQFIDAWVKAARKVSK